MIVVTAVALDTFLKNALFLWFDKITMCVLSLNNLDEL